MIDTRFETALANALSNAGINVNNAVVSSIADFMQTELKSLRFYTLPDVLYARVDTSEVEDSVVSIVEAILKVTLYPADPLRLFLSSLATIIAMQNAELDYNNKMNLLRYSRGVFLDHLGAFLHVFRLDEFPAKTTLKFKLQIPRAIPTTIPLGTRATTDSKIFFATDSILVIPAGDLYGEISATCLTYGISGNGIIKGKIDKIVDLIPGVDSVENTDITTGGSNLEDDESFRLRIHLAPASFSTAGSTLSYVYWALTAHGNISDVSVISPLPVVINVFVMLKGGVIPDADGAEIKAVIEILNETQHRPLSDFVAVYPINHEPVDYSIQWFITSSQATQFNEINERIKTAVKEYEAWQVERAGRDIVPDRLIKMCLEAGAKRVILDGLYFTHIDKSSVANFIENPDRIIFGGVESE
jgi:phage-related baseplate assembly protein